MDFTAITAINYLFCFLMMVQILFFVQYNKQYPQRSIKLYIFYLCCVFAFQVLANKRNLFSLEIDKIVTKITFLQSPIYFLAIAIYCFFISSFLEIEKYKLRLNKVLLLFGKLNVVLFFAFIILFFYNKNLHSIAFNILAAVSYIFMITLLVLFFKYKFVNGVYILWGTCFLVAGGFISQLLSIFYNLNIIYNYTYLLVPVQISIIIELIFFNKGILEKNRGIQKH